MTSLGYFYASVTNNSDAGKWLKSTTTKFADFSNASTPVNTAPQSHVLPYTNSNSAAKTKQEQSESQREIFVNHVLDQQKNKNASQEKTSSEKLNDELSEGLIKLWER